MKFTAFKEFRPSQKKDNDDLMSYLGHDLKKILRDLQLGLNKLSFVDNFDSFIETVTIPATTEVTIRNKLDTIPTQRIIIKGGNGAQNIVDGPTPWNLNNVFMYNAGATSVDVSILFLK